LSSLYDFATFAVMLWIFHAHAPLFRSAWFVESLATQSLVVFVIRTRRLPFFSSRPSRPLLATTLAVVAIGIIIPYSPVAHVLGFQPLPLLFLAILVAMATTYLALAELAKAYFFRSERRRDGRGVDATGAVGQARGVVVRARRLLLAQEKVAP
jgi:Mg2+-importing ATPase